MSLEIFSLVTLILNDTFQNHIKTFDHEMNFSLFYCLELREGVEKRKNKVKKKNLIKRRRKVTGLEKKGGFF